MASMQQPPNRRAYLVPTLLLSFAVLMSWYFRFSPNEMTSQLKYDFLGSVVKADRLPAWLRSNAIDKLNTTSSASGEINDALKAVQKWASRSQQNNNDTLIVDVITIGSMKRMDHMLAQRKTWASKKRFVRNIFMAAEVNTDQAIIPSDGSCKELLSACAGYFRDDDEDLCLQRRTALAVGASVRRYRKIIRSLVLINSGSSFVKGSIIDESTFDWKENTFNTLPNFLIITLDSAYYDTERLENCMGHGGKKSPTIYAPLVSWADANLSVKLEEEEQSNSSFAYPADKGGVVFNKAALEIWIRRIACFSSKDGSLSPPLPISYDPKTHQVEHNWCTWMDDIMAKGDTKGSQQIDPFKSVIRKTLEISLSAERKQTHYNQDEFVYSSLHQTVSISDIFSICSSTLHMLCKSSMDIKRIPSVQELLGYLIHTFQLSRDGLHTMTPESKLQCRAATSDQCSRNGTVACVNLTLDKLNDMI